MTHGLAGVPKLPEHRAKIADTLRKPEPTVRDPNCRYCMAPRKRGGPACAFHQAKINVAQRNTMQRYKDQVYAHYGSVCNCCGETEPLFLSVDHIDGHELPGRVRHNRGGGGSTYSVIVKQGFPDNIQILCMNCNFGRSRDPEGICPHQRTR